MYFIVENFLSRQDSAGEHCPRLEWIRIIALDSGIMGSFRGKLRSRMHNKSAFLGSQSKEKEFLEMGCKEEVEEEEDLIEENLVHQTLPLRWFLSLSAPSLIRTVRGDFSGQLASRPDGKQTPRPLG